MRLKPSSLPSSAIVEDGDEAQILREDVDVVVRRHHDGGLELAR